MLFHVFEFVEFRFTLAGSPPTVGLCQKEWNWQPSIRHRKTIWILWRFVLEEVFFLSQSSKSLSHYQPSCKGGRLYLPNSPNLCPVLCLEPCSCFLTNSHCSKMYVLHLHVQKREPPLVEGEPCVQGLPVTSCCGMWGTGTMMCEFIFHAFSNCSNSGYLKHKRNWSEDRMCHRIHGQTKELAWGKIGARENSGNQGS